MTLRVGVAGMVSMISSRIQGVIKHKEIQDVEGMGGKTGWEKRKILARFA